MTLFYKLVRPVYVQFDDHKCYGDGDGSLALGLGEGGEQSAPMAHAVIGGVITSTLLTLVVVPVIFTYLDDLKNFMLRQTRRFMS